MKKELKTELTKEKIMDAAMAEFGTKGYTGASLNTICGADIPKGLLYHNFKSKDALYLACVKHSFDRLTVCLKDGAPELSLRQYMNIRLRFFEENEQEARLFFESLLQPPPLLEKQIFELRKEFDQLNQELYQKILTGIQLRAGVTSQEAMNYFTLMQNMFNGYFSSPALCGIPLFDAVRMHEEQALKLLDFMIYGIAERGNMQ